jgi:anti-anti-sigma factor
MVKLENQTVDGVRVVRVSGALNQQGVDVVENEFQAALPDGARAVVDLADVDLITTPGIALIISASKRLRNTSGRVVFSAATGNVRELMRRCRLDEVLEFAGDRKEAVEKAKT